MKDPERDPRETVPPKEPSQKAVITLTVEQDTEDTDDHAYVINAESEGLKGGEETLLVILEAFVATLKVSLGKQKKITLS
jgi:hypothetical protein